MVIQLSRDMLINYIILGSIRRDVLKIAIRFPKSEFPLKTQAIPFNITTTLWIVDSRAPSSYMISAVCSTLWRNYIARPLYSPSKFERPPEETQQDAHQNPRSFTFLSMLHLVPLFIQVNGGCEDFLLLHTSRHRYPLGRRIYAVIHTQWEELIGTKTFNRGAKSDRLWLKDLLNIVAFLIIENFGLCDKNYIWNCSQS